LSFVLVRFAREGVLAAALLQVPDGIEIAKRSEIAVPQNLREPPAEPAEPEVVREPQPQRQGNPRRIRIYFPWVHREHRWRTRPVRCVNRPEHP
jgi:hypothetical protein